MAENMDARIAVYLLQSTNDVQNEIIKILSVIAHVCKCKAANIETRLNCYVQLSQWKVIVPTESFISSFRCLSGLNALHFFMRMFFVAHSSQIVKTQARFYINSFFI